MLQPLPVACKLTLPPPRSWGRQQLIDFHPALIEKPGFRLKLSFTAARGLDRIGRATLYMQPAPDCGDGQSSAERSGYRLLSDFPIAVAEAFAVTNKIQ
jgi:hypothetical protein